MAATSAQKADEGEAQAIRARLEAIGVLAPRAESVVADFANDPPLSRSLTETAIAEAARIVEGVGAAMLASRARRGVIAVRDAAAHKEIAAAIRAADAKSVRVERLPDVWPTVGLDRDLDCRYAWVLDGEALLDIEAAALARPRAARRVTIAGEVARPGVFAAQQGSAAAHNAPTVEALVAAAGGATVPADAWVAFDGGAYGGTLADREAPVRTALLLVLPAAHALVARARLSIADQLRRAASACEGCRACTDLCPVALDGTPLAPHALVASLAAGTDRGTDSAAASACTGCALCDAACPAGLSPAALVGAIKSHLPTDLPRPARAAAHPDRAHRRTSIDLLLLRAGLTGFAAR